MSRLALALVLAATVGFARVSLADPGLDPLYAVEPGLEDDRLGQATDDEREEADEDLDTRRRKTAARSCRKMTRQIEHYQEIVVLAQQRDDELWEERMQLHVNRLLIRRAARCPEYNIDDKTWDQIKAFMLLAGEIAIKYFTFGLF